MIARTHMVLVSTHILKSCVYAIGKAAPIHMVTWEEIYSYSKSENKDFDSVPHLTSHKPIQKGYHFQVFLGCYVISLARQPSPPPPPLGSRRKEMLGAEDSSFPLGEGNPTPVAYTHHQKEAHCYVIAIWLLDQIQ